jgi:hypothetical protein
MDGATWAATGGATGVITGAGAGAAGSATVGAGAVGGNAAIVGADTGAACGILSTGGGSDSREITAPPATTGLTGGKPAAAIWRAELVAIPPAVAEPTAVGCTPADILPGAMAAAVSCWKGIAGWGGGNEIGPPIMSADKASRRPIPVPAAPAAREG